MRWDVFRVWSNPMHIDHICFSTVGLFLWCWSCRSFMTYDITNGKLQSYNHDHRTSPGHQPPWSCELAMSKSLPEAWVKWPRILSQNKIRCFISDTLHNTTSYHSKIQLIHHVGEVCWLNLEELTFNVERSIQTFLLTNNPTTPTVFWLEAETTSAVQIKHATIALHHPHWSQGRALMASRSKRLRLLLSCHLVIPKKHAGTHCNSSKLWT